MNTLIACCFVCFLFSAERIVASNTALLRSPHHNEEEDAAEVGKKNHGASRRLQVVVPTPTNRFRFEGNVKDSIGGILGVLQGPASYSPVAMQGSQSLKLSCCNASVTLDNNQLKNAFTNYTVAVWFQADSTGGKRYLYEEGGAITGFGIRLNGAKLEAVAIEGGGGFANVKVATSTGQIVVGQWHLAVALYSSGVLSVALDGAITGSVDSGFGPLGKHSSSASIGAPGLMDSNKVGNNFVGLIDDLRIWDGTTLDTNQVASLFPGATQTNAPIIPTPAPVASPTPPPVVSSVRPNILLFVADDMNFDSPGFMGGVAPNVTPNLDKLANQSMVFRLAHAAVSVCQPSRQAMLSGKYPPNYGSVGFWPMAEGTPTVVTQLQPAGYLTAAFYKIFHMLPQSSFPWDMTDITTVLNGRQSGPNGVLKEIGRSPTVLAEATKQTIAESKRLNKPFFLVINSADPHRPFHGSDGFLNSTYQIETPSRVYSRTEVTVPNPLPDLLGVRTDVAQYASSMRRLDDTIGRCLAALDAAGVADNTVVMFVSDNGMPMPFGKFETYRDGYNGPLLVRWPGRAKPGTKDSTNLISLTDIAPTILEIAGAQALPNIFGRSLVPLIDQKPGVVWRDVVVGNRYEDIFYGNQITSEAERQQLRAQGWVDAPDHMNPGTMRRTCNKRSITDGTYHYIYNHFYDEFHAKNRTSLYDYQFDPSFQAMQTAAATNATIANRVNFYFWRAKEEFYNIRTDPGSTANLVGKASAQTELSSLKLKLLQWMQDTNDPQLADYQAFVNSTVV